MEKVKKERFSSKIGRRNFEELLARKVTELGITKFECEKWGKLYLYYFDGHHRATWQNGAGCLLFGFE